MYNNIGYVFQQDNAPIHVSRETEAWLQEKIKINVLSWPACSPDQHPIEQLCGIIVRRVYADIISNMQLFPTSKRPLSILGSPLKIPLDLA